MSLALSRKLLSDPSVAIHGKVMAKKVFSWNFDHFFLSFFIDCAIVFPKVLGLYKQATHWGPDDEPLFYFGVHLQWLGSPRKWPILDITWLNMAGLSMFKSGSKGSKMVILTVFDH